MEPEVRFSKAGASIAGSICGVALAMGVPWVLLSFGQALSATALTVLVSVGVCVGALMALASAFFGLVIPSEVGGTHGNPFDPHGPGRSPLPPGQPPHEPRA